MFDIFDRQMYKREIWHAYEVGAQPLVFFDGSVSSRKTSNSNPGWNPVAPDSPSPLFDHVGPPPPSPQRRRRMAGDSIGTRIGEFFHPQV